MKNDLRGADENGIDIKERCQKRISFIVTKLEHPSQTNKVYFILNFNWETSTAGRRRFC